MGKQEDMIIKDIKNAFNETKKQMGMYLTFEIQQTYESVIDKFYREFTPRFYRRTFYTYKGSNRADDHSGIDFEGDNVIAGIIVDSKYIPGNPYRADKDWVFDRTFIEGIHGMRPGFQWDEKKKRYKNQYIESQKRYYKNLEKKKDKDWFGDILKELKGDKVTKKVKQDKTDYKWIRKHMSWYVKNQGTVKFVKKSKGLKEQYSKNEDWRNLFKYEEHLKKIAKGYGKFKAGNSPKKRMDREFKKIKKRSRLDDLFEQFFEANSGLKLKVNRRYAHGISTTERGHKWSTNYIKRQLYSKFDEEMKQKKYEDDIKRKSIQLQEEKDRDNALAKGEKYVKGINNWQSEMGAYVSEWMYLKMSLMPESDRLLLERMLEAEKKIIRQKGWKWADIS